ncbi:MMPL family protein [Eubacterium ruminantium]|nr:MMPL family protein [Eubacterium ruminantium]
MNKIAGFFVKGRYALLIIFFIFSAVSFFLMEKVTINPDMSKYLPDSSKMKEGTKILADEFPGMTEPNGIRVMFDGLSEEEKPVIRDRLKNISYVDSVDYEAGEAYNRDEHTLYILNTGRDYDSKEFKSITDTLDKEFDKYNMVYFSNETGSGALPTFIVAGAVAILMIILFLMTDSWTEPFLFIISIGLSILINMGTNVFLPSVSQTTHSIASILQLVLAMDYSIILSNRYRQTKKRMAGEAADGTVDPCRAMHEAIASAIPSVCSSSLTTIVGLLALCFMSFKIGTDLGIVLAKGVFISLICVFTVLPGLIILFDRLIQKTSKKSLTVPTGGLSKLEYKGRIVLSVLFVMIFAGVFVLRDKAKITYGSPSNMDEISKVFPRENRFVLLYSNSDEAKIPEILDSLKGIKGVTAINTYANTLGSRLNAGDMFDYICSMFDLTGASGGSGKVADMLGGLELNADMLRFIYYDIVADHSKEKLTLEQFVGFVNKNILTNPLFAGQLDDASLKAFQEFGTLCNKQALSADRTAAEISKMFGVNEKGVKLLMKYLDMNTISISELLEALKRPEVVAAISLTDALSQKDWDEISFYQVIVQGVMNEKDYTGQEMATLLGLISSRMSGGSATSVPVADDSILRYVKLIYEFYFAAEAYDETWELSLDDLFNGLLQSKTFSPFIDEDSRKMLNTVALGLAAGKSQLVGQEYSLFVISTILKDGEDESMDFDKYLDSVCEEKLSGQYYLIGSTPMAVEMSKTFKAEMNKITLITALTIFMVVLITFRNFLIPLILVLLIQCSVYITMTVMSIMGSDMNYLALLIVQSLLMGATIDYAIVFTNFYIEKRNDRDKKEALASAYKASIRTILTSGMIMIFITWILGYVFPDPASGEICHIISIGVACALVMILCFLPGILVVCDRLIVRKKL